MLKRRLRSVRHAGPKAVALCGLLALSAACTQEIAETPEFQAQERRMTELRDDAESNRRHLEDLEVSIGQVTKKLKQMSRETPTAEAQYVAALEVRIAGQVQRHGRSHQGRIPLR